ncbi:hypothetical protein FJW08_07450 [Mesorhizobium sp. B3-2-1]|nr:hypothetical protein FJW08_07450 [Mesorhizobium sp. B3-2-1]
MPTTWRGSRARKLPISPPVGEMPGRAEGGAKDLGLPKNLGAARGRLRCRRDSAPLWPAGHLPHKWGDWKLRRRRRFLPPLSPPHPITILSARWPC